MSSRPRTRDGRQSRGIVGISHDPSSEQLRRGQAAQDVEGIPCGRIYTDDLMSLFVTLARRNVMKRDIRPEQLRAARALINWTREDLAAASGVTIRTLARIENGQTVPRATTLQSLIRSFETAGIEFIAENGGGVGVRLTRRSDST
jgi:DNA-binding XRE family transcriptional regulator